MADDRPVLTDVEQIAQMQRQIDDLRSTVLARAGRSPTGTIEPTILPVPKPDSLFLQGQIVSRATYPALWQWVQDNNLLAAGLFGPADGSTTFGLPDLRGRVLLGAGALAVGALVGSDSVSLTIAQLPSHTHSVSVNAHGDHIHGFNTNNDGAHGDHTGPDLNNVLQPGPGSLPGSYHNTRGDHAHGGATAGSGQASWPHTVNQTAVGTGAAIDVRQAGIAVNWAIWA